MENREMQEEMFRAMFRLKHLNMGGMLKEISVGEYKILEMCSGCPQCGARENGIYVSSMAAQMKVSSPAVSRLLKSMEGKDYLVRHADMIKIFSYLKNSKAMVLAIILLLIVQASCDLSLPQYTSDIVDVGIQQGGIERATPDRMRKETYETLCLFMTDAEIETIEP